MSWPRLARPRDLVDSLVWRGAVTTAPLNFFSQTWWTLQCSAVATAPLKKILSLPFGWAPHCERVPMLRMPYPIHPDLPCLFACATVPAFCSVVIPDAWARYPTPSPRPGPRRHPRSEAVIVFQPCALPIARRGVPRGRTVRAELACLSLSAARSGALLLKGPSSTERWFPRSN